MREIQEHMSRINLVIFSILNGHSRKYGRFNSTLEFYTSISITCKQLDSKTIRL
uniref:Uncharacterized protein n=1 Tax=Pseudomonas marincola TaxID=437900 RepID=A0A653E386_9PSED